MPKQNSSVNTFTLKQILLINNLSIVKSTLICKCLSNSSVIGILKSESNCHSKVFSVRIVFGIAYFPIERGGREIENVVGVLKVVLFLASSSDG